jgi:hypothetical protein
MLSAIILAMLAPGAVASSVIAAVASITPVLFGLLCAVVVPDPPWLRCALVVPAPPQLSVVADIDSARPVGSDVSDRTVLAGAWRRVLIPWR